jgi:prepilin-type N-terminal cleavage/methylation domain-containing protein/prepilin-type processing-associated H-X9-DG protein
MRSSLRQVQCGFTLIELLVTVAIIAILASQMLPALSRTKSATHFTRCKSNLKQMSFALTMYVNDCGAYPFYDNGVSGPIGRTWASSLLPYLSTQKPSWNRQGTIFLCPSDPAFENGSPGLSYGYNARGMAVSGGNTPLGQLGLGGVAGLVSLSTGVSLIPQRESAVLAPSEMSALGDAFSESRGKVYRSIQEWLGFNFSVVMAIVGGPDPQKEARNRHDAKANIAFCDGHVTGVAFNHLFADSEAAYQKWNADHQSHADLRLK